MWETNLLLFGSWQTLPAGFIPRFVYFPLTGRSQPSTALTAASASSCESLRIPLPSYPPAALFRFGSFRLANLKPRPYHIQPHFSIYEFMCNAHDARFPECLFLNLDCQLACPASVGVSSGTNMGWQTWQAPVGLVRTPRCG